MEGTERLFQWNARFLKLEENGGDVRGRRKINAASPQIMKYTIPVSLLALTLSAPVAFSDQQAISFTEKKLERIDTVGIDDSFDGPRSDGNALAAGLAVNEAWRLTGRCIDSRR